MTKVIEARQRLDKTLASPTLSDKTCLRGLIRSQLHNSSRAAEDGKVLNSRPVHGGKQFDQVVDKKSKMLFNLLESLRSAKGERTSKVVTPDNADGMREWKLKQDTSESRVMYCEGPEGTPYHSLCIEGLIDGPMTSALCVAWEAPEYKEWWPQFVAPSFKIVESCWLQRSSVGGDLSLLRVKVPWPLAMREILLSAYELDYFEDDLIVVLLSSAPDEPDANLNGFSAGDIPKLEPNVVRMDLVGGFVLQKIGPDSLYFRLVADLDMKLDFVPPWLINFVARQLAGLGYKLYQKAISAVKGSAFEELIETEPMYLRIKAALDSVPRGAYVGAPSPMHMMSPGKDTQNFLGFPFKEEFDSLEFAFSSLSDRRPQNTIKEAEKEQQDFGKETLTETERPSQGSCTNRYEELENGRNYSHDQLSFIETHRTLSNEAEKRAPCPLWNGLSSVGALVEASPMHELQEQLRPEDKLEKSSDVEVAWAIDVLDKLIALVKQQKANSQPTGSSPSPHNNKVTLSADTDPPACSAENMSVPPKVGSQSGAGEVTTLEQLMFGTSRLRPAATLEDKMECGRVESVTRSTHQDGDKFAKGKVTDVGSNTSHAELPANLRHRGHGFFSPFRLGRKHLRNKNNGNRLNRTGD